MAAGVGALAAPLDPNLLEEGIVTHTAERMAQGEHLYRDVVSFTGPLPYELLALFFRALGARLEIARALVLVFQGLGVGLLFAAARRSGAGPFAHPIAAAVACAPVLLVPLFSIYFYTTLGFYLGLAAVYAGVRAVDSPRWAPVVGALLAAVALCKQNTGVQLAAAFLPALVLCSPAGFRLRRMAGAVGGGAAVAALTLAFYAVRGDLSSFAWSQTALPLALASAATYRTPVLDLWPPGELSPLVRESWVMYLPNLYHMKYGLFVEIGRGIVLLTQALYALPLAALAATALRAFFVRLPPLVWLHGAFLLAMTANLYPRGDWGHLAVSLPPAAAQLLLLGARADGRSFGAAARAGAALAALALAAGVAVTGTWLHRISGPAVFGPRVPFRAVSQAYRTPAVPRVIHYLRRRAEPGEAIFVARQEPLLYFATGTRNPTRFEGVLPGLREWQETEIVPALEAVRFAVMSDIDQPIYTYYADELPAVQRALERYFEIPPDYPIDDHSWIAVLQRGRDRGATAVDFVDERERGRAWIRNVDGAEAPAAATPQRLATRHLRRPLPVALGSAGGGIDFDVRVPDGAVFQAGAGYRGLVSIDHQYLHAPGTTLHVAVRNGAGADFERLTSLRIDDRPRAGRRWTPVEADLAAYAGRDVTLRLEVEASQPLPPGALAWWGSPRIAIRSGSD